ncbi:carbohydrate esterase family 4 protein [Sphaerobolus stellatus SS14]|uniref:Carbohydrate esterase family 4 protein n=1 Tax=Sphaerobolus stellatus (strain SS14) TaxID=990650 RepID=A0A0C9VH73_SPHS4|nr:carbohydrate esterase family 4 protein [Sphaerobolus stellatus SS14]
MRKTLLVGTMLEALFVVSLLLSSCFAVETLANVYTSCRKPNVVALTFDDGPYIYEADIAATLTNAGIKGTFFVNGNDWKCIYDGPMVTAMRTAFSDGHEFGSHTWHHYNLSALPVDGVGGLHDEMWRTERKWYSNTRRLSLLFKSSHFVVALQRVLGVNPAMMRPPYGAYTNQVRNVAASRNQSLIIWDMDPRDSDGATVAQQKAAYTDVANRHPTNILTINHETHPTIVKDLLPFAIKTLRAKGYQFVTVSECLGISPYQWYIGPQARTADWKCN